MTAPSKHTPGAVIVAELLVPEAKGRRINLRPVELGLPIGFFGTKRSAEENEANAALAAEAFNVAHETELTPMELAASHQEAMILAKHYRETIERLEQEIREL